MTTEVLQVVAGVAFTAILTAGVTYRWLNKTTAALDAIPGLVDTAREALGTAKAAHNRLDAQVLDMGQRFERHGDRLTRMEARWDSHDREQDRRDKDLADRFDRLEAKIDALLERH